MTVGYLAQSKDELVRVKMLLDRLGIPYERLDDSIELGIEAGHGVRFMKNMYLPMLEKRREEEE